MLIRLGSKGKQASESEMKFVRVIQYGTSFAEWTFGFSRLSFLVMQSNVGESRVIRIVEM